jgi:LysM repeat protein
MGSLFASLSKPNPSIVKRTLFLWIALAAIFYGLPAMAQVEPVEVTPAGIVQEVEGRPYFFHHVKQGQTLYSIARAYAVSQELIISENPDVAFGLRYDQVIRIPVFLVKVAPQETVYGLSRKFGITREQLRAFNPAIAEDGLKAGMTLAIPGLETTGLVRQQPDTIMRQPMIYLPPEPAERLVPQEMPPCAEASPSSSYQVALLVPLYLEEVGQFMDRESDSFDPGSFMPLHHKSFSFLPYYQGVLLALDSIRAQGVDITLHVHDVCQDLSKARRLVLDPGFREMDLIIGPFFRNSLEYIAIQARQYGIPVVSPLLSDQGQLAGFPNLFQATPSLETQLDNLARYLARSHAGHNILLVHNNQPGAIPMINAFKASLNREMLQARRFSDSLHLARINGYFVDETLVGGRVTRLLVMNDSLSDAGKREEYPAALTAEGGFREVVYQQTGMEGLVRELNRDGRNAVVTLIGGEAFLSNYLRELSIHGRNLDVSVFGIPEWKDYQSVEIDYLQQLNVHIFTPDFHEYEDPHIRDFVRRFRETFDAEPGDYAFRGVQTAYFFFSALQHYGKSFPSCLEHIDAMGLDSPYRFRRPMGHANGWENQHSTLFRYHDFRQKDVRRNYEAEWPPGEAGRDR